MLDLRWVVENRAAVEQMLADRGGTLDLSRGDPWALDTERRALLQKVEQLRHRQKVCGEEIARRAIVPKALATASPWPARSRKRRRVRPFSARSAM